jgi:hypothetical protein
MSPGYVRWHPRVLDYKLDRGLDPEPGRLVCQVTLATFPSLWLGSPWRGWTEWLGDPWREPDDAKHAALARLELRWPIPDATLPRPHRPARPGHPNLRDAKAAVRALVAQINQTAGPVLAKLEGGDQR